MSAVNRIAEALIKNPKCGAGVLGSNHVFAIENGPSGGPELLCLIFADEKHLGYWYGYIRVANHHSRPRFVAMLVWLKVFVNSPTVPLLFKRFDYWTLRRGEYEPCTIQNVNDAFIESSTFTGAADGLVHIISRFEINMRYPCENAPEHDDPIEMRIVDVYGLASSEALQGRDPGPPMPTILKLVVSHR